MKRKRFEKLMMGRYGKAPRDLRDAVREIIEIRHIEEQEHGIFVVYSRDGKSFRVMKTLPYKETLKRIENRNNIFDFGEEEEA